MDVFDLTPDQQKAFNRFKKAYKDCQKLKVMFINVYGTLSAVDSNKIKSFGDETVVDEPMIQSYDADDPERNSIKIPCEWSDDESMHRYGLTPKGFKILNSN